jgi:hypothetical protein
MACRRSGVRIPLAPPVLDVLKLKTLSSTDLSDLRPRIEAIDGDSIQVRRLLDPNPATGQRRFTDQRSATWTGHNSTATGRHQPPPSPQKAPPTSRRCTRPPHGPSSTRPGLSAACAPPSRENAATLPPLGRSPPPAVTETSSSPSPWAKSSADRRFGRGGGEGLSIRSLRTSVATCRASLPVRDACITGHFAELHLARAASCALNCIG